MPSAALSSSGPATASTAKKKPQARLPRQTIHWPIAPLLGKTAAMKRSSLLLAIILAFASSTLFAQGKIDLQPSDTILSILQKNIGQTVELRMKSGEKIGGKVEKVGDKLVQLSQLMGAEFYDAAVDAAEGVAAVIVRIKSK